ncbi:MAG TPA: hypothetical protein VGB89_17150 [Bacteroidota bacterium]
MIVGNRNRLAPLRTMKPIFLPLLLLTSGLSVRGVGQESLVNFSHLEHLTERIPFARDTVSIVHVYANYPDYQWVDAKESGPEGIACVDDAARAAVVYLRHYELTKDVRSLSQAKDLLKFVLNMQADDGEFYNFIHADHSINKDGKTSFKSFGWWASRAVWCMALGYRVLPSVDSAFAMRLQQGVEKSLPHVEKLLAKYGTYQTMQGYRVPQWLLYESGADATTELLFGLNEYYAATQDKKVKRLIEKLADGIMAMQDGDIKTFPYGLCRSWQTIWHMWGNGQTQALAQAGKMLKNKKMINSAEREAKGWYSRLLIQGFLKEMDVAAPGQKLEYEQIAYAMRPMIVGLIRLYEATGKAEYLKMAGRAGSWFFGNNVAHEQMYDPVTGRCYDGIRDSVTINKNSGAESTIEALHALVEVERYPVAMKLLNYRRTRGGESASSLYAVFENSQGDELTLVLDLKKSKVVVLEGEKSKKYGGGK